MKKLLSKLKTNLPALIAAALVAVNALEQAGTISLSTKLIVVVNAILAAFGLGIIHLRQQASK